MVKKPQHIRNFWIEIEVDGRKTKVACGPRAKDGGFTLKIKQRTRGEIAKKDTIIRGEVRENGCLWLTLQPVDTTTRKIIRSTMRD